MKKRPHQSPRLCCGLLSLAGLWAATTLVAFEAVRTVAYADPLSGAGADNLVETPAPRVRLALDVLASRMPEDTGSIGTDATVAVEEAGAGIALSAGYFVNPTVEIGLRLQGAVHESADNPIDYGHGSVLLELRWFPSPSGTVRPYVVTGVGGTNLSADAGGPQVQIRGATAVVGSGAFFPLNRHFGLDLSGRWQWINWEETHLSVGSGSGEGFYTPNDKSGGAGQLSLGLTLLF